MGKNKLKKQKKEAWYLFKNLPSIDQKLNEGLFLLRLIADKIYA